MQGPCALRPPTRWPGPRVRSPVRPEAACEQCPSLRQSGRMGKAPPSQALLQRELFQVMGETTPPRDEDSREFIDRLSELRSQLWLASATGKTLLLVHFISEALPEAYKPTTDQREVGPHRASCIDALDSKRLAQDVRAKGYLECSALSNRGVQQVFECAIRTAATRPGGETDGDSSPLLSAGSSKA
ncbi:Rho-related GTP-binding protein RhoH [Heterocephalus glaber]|uniref:Rho-related GTP-binding protein RhoH n=1 Tax=Heterocephalus glaber TaxID=10181 RepID=G5BI57_HETGA|nr:Rho-related GTP-binding protein RhoH [Heterocephalus glaber]